MLKSMTAFGRAQASAGGRDITVEMKSVNNRFFDCSVRMPRTLGFTEDRVKPFLTEKGITRGKVDVIITVEQQEKKIAGLSLDEDYAKAYIDALRELRDKFGLADDISVMKVAADRAVFTVEKEDEADAEKDWADVSAVIGEAADVFLSAREAEGGRIEADLLLKLGNISDMVDKIEKLSEKDVAGARARIEERLGRVLSDLGLKADETKVLSECAAYADRIAIDEELVRLRSHFGAFRDIIAGNEPAGRKLDFLIQEMNREINTIGSKCQNSEAAQTVVGVKCEIEKIREQIQNIE